MTEITLPLKAQRDLSSDLLRGIAILGVVAIHTSGVFPYQGLNLVTNAFHVAVPVFLILSAYFSYLSLQKRPEPYSQFIRRRLPKLLLAYFVYSLLYFFIIVDWPHISPSQIITRHFLGRGWSGQYFFIILIQLLFVYPLLAKVRISLLAAILTVLSGFLFYPALQVVLTKSHILQKVGDLPLIYWYPYAIIGMYLAQNQQEWRALVKRIPRVIGIIIFILLPFAIFWITPKDLKGSEYMSATVMLVSVLIVPIFFVHFNQTRSRFLEIAGEKSLSIFCLNPLFVILLQRLGIHFPIADVLWTPVYICAHILLVLIVAGLCLVVANGLQRIGLKNLAM